MRSNPLPQTPNTMMDYPVVLYTDMKFGIVEEAITAGHKGWIKFSGSYWAAKLFDQSDRATIAPGTTVLVKGRQGNSLLVMPVQQEQHPTHDRPSGGSWFSPLTSQVA
ncbi:MAG: NfeD family protein [Prochlorotrichaceae cyanobacterium]